MPDLPDWGDPDTPEAQPLAQEIAPADSPLFQEAISARAPAQPLGSADLARTLDPAQRLPRGRQRSWLAKGSPEAAAHMAKARAARRPAAERAPGEPSGAHGAYGRRKAGDVSRAHALHPQELREWLERLGMSVSEFAFLIGRSEQSVYLWLAGDLAINNYVVRWLELLAAFERFARARMPMAELLAAVHAHTQNQPWGSESQPERIAQRLGLPFGMVKEAVRELRREGLLT